MTDKPGVEQNNADKAETQQASAPAKKKRLGKILAAAGAVGAVALLMNQCDGGKQTPQAPSSPASPPTASSATPVMTAQRGPYYQVVRPTLPRDENGAQRSPVAYAPGGCVSEFRDANGNTGGHPKGLTKVFVHLTDGTAYSTHIRRDDLAPVAEGSFPAGQCWAGRMVVEQKQIQPTYVVKNEDINLRSVPDRNMQPWGILRDGSCVLGTGEEKSDMMKVEVLPSANSPHQTPAYKWVLMKQLHVALQEPCTATFEKIPAGHPGAGVTVNPWQPR